MNVVCLNSLYDCSLLEVCFPFLGIQQTGVLCKVKSVTIFNERNWSIAIFVQIRNLKVILTKFSRHSVIEREEDQ